MSLGEFDWMMAFLFTLPVMIAVGLAFAILCSPPTYLCCRHLAAISAAVAWSSSAKITWWPPNLGVATGKYLWYLTPIKDGFVATLIVVSIVAIKCGFLSTCFCYRGATLQSNSAPMYMKPVAVFARNNDVICSAMITVELVLHVASFTAIF